MRTALFLAVLAACGADDPRTEEVSCSTDWEAAYPQFSLSGRCDRGCQVRALDVDQTGCTIRRIVNGVPNSPVDCGTIYDVVIDGDVRGCCELIGRDIGNGDAVFDVRYEACE